MSKPDIPQETFFKVDWDAELEEDVTEKEKKLISKVAKRVVELDMVAPAIMFLYPMKPLNFISSQLLLFLEPFTAHVLGFDQMITFRRALSKRATVGILIDEIERIDAEERPPKKPLLRKLTKDIKDSVINRFKKKNK
ncbi:MAG: hypothetical protein ACLFSQ_06470 [Candidatus Zixiibacteriota bacterium]